MNSQAMRFRLGVFVLAALVLLAALIIFFGGWPDLFTRYHRYTVTFDNAPDVAPGTPVRRSGVRIGEVKKVELDDETGQVRVQIAVEPKYTLRRRDEPTLVHGLLGGDTTIDFIPRPGKAQPGDANVVEPGSELAGVAQANVGTVLNQTSGVLEPAQDAVQEMRQGLRNLNRMTPLMGEALREFRDTARATRDLVPEIRDLVRESRRSLPLLRRTAEEVQVTAGNWGKLGERLSVLLQTNEQKLERAVDNWNRTLNNVASTFDEENRKNLAAILRNVRAGSDHLEGIAKNTDDLVRESGGTIRRVNDAAVRADDVLAAVQQAVKPLPESGSRILKNLDESMQKLNALLGDLRELLRGMGTGDGSLRRFLTDPTLYTQLNEAACLLLRVLPRLDRALRDVEVFADKVARHPEVIGLEGLLRPSSGIKESPYDSVHGRPPGH
jgi:phospholipid/cholesterol/gamma-HCH transport system substrate-binding protein